MYKKLKKLYFTKYFFLLKKPPLQFSLFHHYTSKIKKATLIFLATHVPIFPKQVQMQNLIYQRNNNKKKHIKCNIFLNHSESEYVENVPLDKGKYCRHSVWLTQNSPHKNIFTLN